MIRDNLVKLVNIDVYKKIGYSHMVGKFRGVYRKMKPVCVLFPENSPITHSQIFLKKLIAFVVILTECIYG